jgi:glucose-6-phosphate isomerase
VVWGEPGTNGQHAYFQMLHQGTETIPVEFILVKEADARAGGDGAVAEALARQQRMLLANGLAQSQALMLGRSTVEALAEQPKAPLGAGVDAATLAAHRTFPGNRPSTTLLLERLTPRSLGALIALYEHRVFTAGIVWGIDSFDQWGVELGKGLGNELLAKLGAAAGADPGGRALDASTAGLLARLRA